MEEHSTDIPTPLLRDCDGRREVFDPVRRRYVALTPEEWVRQHTILLLHHRYGYPLQLMQVEGAITLNGLTKRCDIVVYGAGVRPLLIVECKREQVALTQKVLDQACRYNIVLQVPYLLLTNGRRQICVKSPVAGSSSDIPSLTAIPIPSWQELNEKEG